MDLHKILQFTGARVEKFSVTPAEDIKGVIGVAVLMTREHAEILHCDGFLEGDTGTIVRETAGNTLPLNIELHDVEFHLPERSTLFPEIVHKFKLERVPNAQVELSFLVHLPAHNILELAEFVTQTNKDTFGCAIRSRQGELFEGGTRVDLAAKPAPTSDAGLFACPHCDADVPLTDDGTGHVVDEGEVIPCVHPSATAVRAMKSSGSVASMAEMARV
jgi:hypothetical protein